MSVPTTQGQPATERKPEKKPPPEVKFGRNVSVWINTTEREGRTRSFRTITISPPRFFDQKIREWRDGSGFRPDQVGSLIAALQEALRYALTTPVPGEEDEEPESHNIPF